MTPSPQPLPDAGTPARLRAGTTSAAVVAKYVRAADRLGLPQEELFRLTGLGPQDIANPDGRIPMPPYLRLWQAMIEAFPGIPVGLKLAENYSQQEWGVIGFAMLHSPTVKSALEKLQRFQQLVNTNVEIGFSVERDTAYLSVAYRMPELDSLWPLIDFGLLSMAKGLKAISNGTISLTTVDLRRPQPPETGVYEQAFGILPSYDQTHNRIGFAADWLDRPLDTASPTVAAYLEQVAEQFLSSPATIEDDLTPIRSSIQEALIAGDASQAAVAKSLCLSSRTLQRRLEDAGTSFSELLQQVRTDLASQLLQQPKVSTMEVAVMLGYSELSSFHRAFKRWTGLTPEQFRHKAG